jgi:murein DD-endopeptidase MepM/ murein hydrolase activator NlpD
MSWTLGALLFAATLAATPAAAPPPAASTARDPGRVVFPASVSQGAMVIGKVPPGSQVRHGGRQLRVTAYGSVVFGVGRDATAPLQVEVARPDGGRERIAIAVTPRDWPIEEVRGVPPRTVDPPPEVAARIAREAEQVGAARARDDARADFAQAFIWPVAGRLSGRFGNQRIYNGKPGSPHSGMDIAAPAGTPVRAPAAGVVTLAAADFYITGGTLIIDHGHGISSNFLHLSRIDVKVGDRVEQGQVVAAVGATGRATGPHLHWGMNWFDVRIDPLLVLERAKLAARSVAIPLDGPHAVLQGATNEGPRPDKLADFAATLRRCLEDRGLSLATTLINEPVIVLREGGQELELVMPAEIGAYVFWPGRKPGEAMAYPLIDGRPQAMARELAQRYFEGPPCLASG